mgnify:FL=1
MNKKLISGLASVLLVFSFLIFPGRGLAQTTDPAVQALMVQIQALLATIQRLQAQLAALQGGQTQGQSQEKYMQVTGGVGPVVNINPSQKFAINDKVQSTFDLNVRVAPGGSAVAVVPPHTKGTIAGGPQQGGVYWWWQVNYDNGSSGYSVGDFLEKIDVLGGETTGNKAPVLTTDAFVSPTSVGANDSNWWRLEGTDPEGGSVIYKVEWGDGTSDFYTLASGQSAPARHIFSSVGNFQLKLTATDQAGASASRLISVNVIDGGKTLSQPSTKFKIGDTAQATDNINVRTYASGVPSGVQPVGAKATVVGGPVWSIVGSWWWNLDYQTGVDGWSAEDWLTKTGTSVVTNTCGDINADGVINQTDVTALVSHIFSGASVPAGVNPDLNGDGVADVFDQIALSNYLGGQGLAPTCVAVPVVPPVTPTSTSSITVLSPNGGEIALIGQRLPVKWTSSLPSNSSVAIYLEFLKDNQVIKEVKVGTAYNWVGTAGNFDTIIPPRLYVQNDTIDLNSYPDMRYKVKVVSTENGVDTNVYDFSDSVFSAIAPPALRGSLAITFPNNGERLEAGKTYDITWLAKDPNRVVTMYLVDLNQNQTFPNPPHFLSQINYSNVNGSTQTPSNLGKYSWTVPSYLRGIGRYKILIEYDPIGYPVNELAWPYAYDESDQAFSIVASGAGVATCGDINADGVINQADVTALINYIFSGASVPVGVNPDLNGDGSPDVFDQIALSNYLAGQAPAPTCVTPIRQNLSPTINSMTGPTSLVAQQSGTWTVLASDPNNDFLYYSVTWGDGGENAQQAGPTFLHTYGAAGTYPARFTVNDGKGGVTKSDVTVIVSTPTLSLACGDINADGLINAADVTVYQNYIFSGGTVLTGVKTDLNGDGQPDVFDLNVLIDRIYSNGPAPTCGVPYHGTAAGTN